MMLSLLFVKRQQVNIVKCFFSDDFYQDIPDNIKIKHDDTFDLKGNYQVWNVKTALCVFLLINENLSNFVHIISVLY